MKIQDGCSHKILYCWNPHVFEKILPNKIWITLWSTNFMNTDLSQSKHKKNLCKIFIRKREHTIDIANAIAVINHQILRWLVEAQITTVEYYLNSKVRKQQNLWLCEGVSLWEVEALLPKNWEQQKVFAGLWVFPQSFYRENKMNQDSEKAVSPYFLRPGGRRRWSEDSLGDYNKLLTKEADIG